MLAMLGANPLAVKPVEIEAPNDDHPGTTSYLYAVAAVGEVVQWRKDANHWEIFLPHRREESLGFLAPEDGVIEIKVRVGRWWFITKGPLAGSFVIDAPGGIGVQPRRDVCEYIVKGDLPEFFPGVVQQCRAP